MGFAALNPSYLLPALLEEALNRRPATTRGRVRRPATRREAIVVALVEKSGLI